MGDGAVLVCSRIATVVLIAVLAAELSTGILSLVVAFSSTETCGTLWYPLLFVGLGHVVVVVGTVIKCLDLYARPDKDGSLLHVDNLLGFGLSIWACVAFFTADCDAPEARRALMASVILLFTYIACAFSAIFACCLCVCYENMQSAAASPRRASEAV